MTFPVFEFSASPDIQKADIKVYIGEAGAGSLIHYKYPTFDPELFPDRIPTFQECLDTAKERLGVVEFQEFGALKDALKFEKKEGSTKTNYGTSKATEANVVFLNCTKRNYDRADLLDGKRIDVVELDEANGTMKIYENLEVSIGEKDENKQHPEINMSFVNDTFSSTIRDFVNLLSSENI